jgi:integrase
VTFNTATSEYIKLKADGWRSEIHKKNFRKSLEDHAGLIMEKSVADINTEDVLKVILPIWSEKNVTAQRVLKRIESILNYSKVRGYRKGDNPASWNENIQYIVAKIPKSQKHFESLNYNEIPELYKSLPDDTKSNAIRFIILTACRSKEALGAHHSEINGNVWIIPKERMKAHRQHSVPLSAAAQLLVESSQGLLFPSSKGVICGSVILKLIKKFNKTITIHGFRASFRTWASEQTDFPREIIELCLAHSVYSETESAYQRSTLIDKRRELMQMWCNFVTGVTG